MSARRGPPPKPTHLRVLRGNPGRRPLNAEEPKPRPVRPEKPKLSKESAEVYDSLVAVTERMGVLTEADGIALELTADAIVDYREVRDKKRKGWRDKKHCRETRSQVVVLLREFGFTPSARTRIKVERPDHDEFEEFLKSGEG